MKGRPPLSLLQDVTGMMVFPLDRSGRKPKEWLCFLSCFEEDPEQVKTGQGLLFCDGLQNKGFRSYPWLGVSVPGVSPRASSSSFLKI